VERTAHNFSNVAPWVDLVFGTFHLPKGEETYALGLDQPWPRGYFAQLAEPFRLQKPSRLATSTPVAETTS
jgi:sterol desaturase/sphingolipid hydroxylase (fatty acid hydroxylase superfamily)